ncbi:MAG: alpha-glucosidase/alpha-galactosidase [Candidatus Heimdallarchaeota archaeon]|nr:MAG: alpha-glucosidase/alpha-galactosidase [Candidatus Heimdallarchaeota archaeon]
MIKVAFIGAGSLVFGETLLTDILTFPTLRDEIVLCLEDIDPKRLDLMYKYMQKYREDNLQILENITIEKTTNQKEAITDAKYIINAVLIGGLDVVKHDLEIPFKYGVTQCVGDTIGPGGVFRFLRTTTFFDSLLEDIRTHGYKSDDSKGLRPLLLNYTNPMAMNTWYCNTISPNSTIGLCHGVFGTAAVLEAAVHLMEVNPQGFDYLCAGINHLAWFLKVQYKDSNSEWHDAYPLIREASKSQYFLTDIEKLRVDMMNATGYFMTETSGHLSEYLPYYRKSSSLLEKYRGDGFYAELDHALDYNEQRVAQQNLEKEFTEKLNQNSLPFKEIPSWEYAPLIINAMESIIPVRINGNVLNKGYITNLPPNCCVEVPIFFDSLGAHPQGGIELPTVCQALCMSNIMVQKAAVEGALTLDREKIYQAVLLDPNTASVCSPVEIREMVEELFEIEKQWLPQFD